MRSLEDIIQELKQLSNKDKAELSSLADEAIKEAIEITRNEKAMHSGFLEPLTNDLAELINLFPDDILLDDLRYHLAHLYMRSQKWKEAENQLVGIKDYLHNEAQIYSALCAFQQGEQLDIIQADIERIAKGLCNSKSFRTKSIQEQHYNLLEMLVYACGLNHSVLEPYYMTGLTRSDLIFRCRVRYFEQNLTKVDLNFGLPKPLSIAKFRLLNLLQYGKKQGFLIIDLTDGRFKELENFTTSLKPLVKRFAEILADHFPGEIAKPEIEAKLINEGLIRDTERSRQTTSELKREFCNIFGENSITTTNTSPTRYKLNHSFILVQNRKR